MEKVTIKVRDGEVEVPVVGKIMDGKDVRTLYRILPHNQILYIYCRTFGYGTCSAEAWRKEELEKAKPCSVSLWNNILYGYALSHIERVTRFITEQTLV